MRDFTGGPVIEMPRFHSRGTDSIPGWGTKILHATHSQKIEREKKKRKDQKMMLK